MADLKILTAWFLARLAATRRDDRGFTSVEWLLIALGVITIAGVAVAAVKSYVTGQTNQLGNP